MSKKKSYIGKHEVSSVYINKALEIVNITDDTVKIHMSVLSYPPVFDNPVFFALRCGPIPHCQDSMVDVFHITVGVIIHTWEKEHMKLGMLHNI